MHADKGKRPLRAKKFASGKPALHINEMSTIDHVLYMQYIQLFQLRLSPEQSGKVEYERERLLGIANK